MEKEAAAEHSKDSGALDPERTKCSRNAIERIDASDVICQTTRDTGRRLTSTFMSPVLFFIVGVLCFDAIFIACLFYVHFDDKRLG